MASFTIADYTCYQDARDLGTVAIMREFHRIINLEPEADYLKQLKLNSLANLFDAYGSLYEAQTKLEELAADLGDMI